LAIAPTHAIRERSAVRLIPSIVAAPVLLAVSASAPEQIVYAPCVDDEIAVYSAALEQMRQSQIFQQPSIPKYRWFIFDTTDPFSFIDFGSNTPPTPSSPRVVTAEMATNFKSTNARRWRRRCHIPLIE
jgi:hypothetical protein